MKTNTSWPLLLAAAFTLTACQEQVATELSTPAASATGGTSGGSSTGTTTGTTTEYTMSLTLANSGTGVSPETAGYIIHQANEESDEACVVESITSTPSSLPATKDITCTVEAEEMVLNKEGLGFTISADKNTCDYVVYEPFSFYRFQPGASLRQDGGARVLLKVLCDDEILAAHPTAVLTSVTGADFGPVSAYTLAQTCGKVFNIEDTGITSDQWGNLDIDAGTAPITAKTSDAAYCSFNHKNRYTLAADKAKAPNCDEGEILFYTVSISGEDLNTNDAIEVGELTATETIPDEATSCAGNVRSCMAGPMPDLLGSEWTDEGLVGKYEKSIVDTAISNTYTVTSPKTKKYSTNRHIANYLRQCSGVDQFQTTANFINGDGTLGVPGAVEYTSDNLGAYAFLTTESDVTQEKDADDMDIVILGDDPFRAGLSDAQVLVWPALVDFHNSAMRANPHYTFLCLDKAKEPKARIRVVVREWNRNFDADADFRFISDVYKATAGDRYQDANTNMPAPFAHKPYNDYTDWDDFLVFDDSGAADCSASYVENGTYTRRDPAWFPRVGL